MFEQLIDDTDFLYDVYEVIPSWDIKRYWGEYDSNTYDKIYPAYGAEELVLMIRAKEEILFGLKTIGIGFSLDFYNNNSIMTIARGDSLTEALCNFLIYLLETGTILTVEDINK